MPSKESIVDCESEAPLPSLEAHSHATAQTSCSDLVTHDVSDVRDTAARLDGVLFLGDREEPKFCFQHMRHFLKDSVAGVPELFLSNGPPYQVQVVKAHGFKIVSKRAAPGMEVEHSRALVWEALVLSVLAVIKPCIIPRLHYIVSSAPYSLQIILDRCECSIKQINSRQGAQSRLTELSNPASSGPLMPFSQAVFIMFQIALALSAAHSLRAGHKDHPDETVLAIIHGNVQPWNVLLRSNDHQPVVCGWSHSMVRWRDKSGLQHVYSAAEVPDDPYHNAPELQAAEDSQSALEALSDRTDVWGFALVSLFLLTGMMHRCCTCINACPVTGHVTGINMF